MTLVKSLLVWITGPIPKVRRKELFLGSEKPLYRLRLRNCSPLVLLGAWSIVPSTVTKDPGTIFLDPRLNFPKNDWYMSPDCSIILMWLIILSLPFFETFYFLTKKLFIKRFFLYMNTWNTPRTKFVCFLTIKYSINLQTCDLKTLYIDNIETHSTIIYRNILYNSFFLKNNKPPCMTLLWPPLLPIPLFPLF